jgi:DNA-binding CsgD family transcriptional regulator
MEVLRTSGGGFGDDANTQSGINTLNGFGKIVLILDPTSKSDLDVLSDQYRRKLELLTLERNEPEEVGGDHPSSDLGLVSGDSLPSASSTITGALSGRQRDVLRLIVQGMSNKEIARALNLAEGTVKIHVAGLFGKLRVHRRAAVAVAGARFLSDAD